MTSDSLSFEKNNVLINNIENIEDLTQVTPATEMSTDIILN